MMLGGGAAGARGAGSAAVEFAVLIPPYGLRAARGAAEREPGGAAEAGGEGDQHVEAEALGLAADEVGHPGLAHAEQLAGSRLGQTAACDGLLEFDHQVGAHGHELGLGIVEAEVREHVAATAGDVGLLLHGCRGTCL